MIVIRRGSQVGAASLSCSKVIDGIRAQGGVLPMKSPYIAATPYNRKAFALLGYNPSDSKLMSMLGVSSETLQNAKIDSTRRGYMRHCFQAALRARRESGKAARMLGLEDGLQKAGYLLGIDDSKDLELAVAEAMTRSHAFMGRNRSFRIKRRPMIDRRSMNKALKVLGYDPSSDKVSRVLGEDVGGRRKKFRHWWFFRRRRI